MWRENNKQASFWGDPIYERIIPKDHFLRQLDELVDFGKVNEMTKSLYSKDMGRPCCEPAMLFKMIYLQFMYDISDRDIEEQVRYNLLFKWFVGLSAEEEPPDYSTLSVFRERLGSEKFEKIFNWIVEEAKTRGFISERLHIIDSTDVAAKVDIIKFGRSNKEADGEDDDKTKKGAGHPDQDARWGYKKKDKPFYGYKFHAGMDADSELITRCKVTSGNRNDGKEFFSVMDGGAKRVVADKGYDAFYIHYLLSGFGIRDLIYRRRRRNKKVKERSWIERKFSECKGVHGLCRARYWGLMKLKIQGYMTAIVVNMKRMIKLATSPPKLLTAGVCGK